MRYGGHFDTAAGLQTEINAESLEFCDSWPHANGTDTVCRFVKYQAGARDGKFHTYVSHDLPKEEFEKLQLDKSTPTTKV